ncbi:hypothetical protein, partial [Phocaeicola coprophilus]|uniref:hypothetical protein n=1 Tax=Phocaeicola coprophilus TaxID=387090 RepID=UPI00145D09A9
RQPEHSTYLVAHDLKSLDYVRQIDYAQFDYIYLMAAPNWKEYDFSKSCCPLPARDSGRG